MKYPVKMTAPSDEHFQSETEDLVNQIYLFDVLRSDRSISSNGLKARTPFLDKSFVQYYLSIPSKMKTFGAGNKIEKFLLRKSFEGSNLLPEKVLWRNKCAFSDGVSSKENSWHKVIQNYIDKKVTDVEFINKSKKFSHCTPISKESYFYRKIFESTFKNHENLIPFFWMPKWSDVSDPSARELDNYKE